ncbi:MAG TPA: hemolysin family protein [Actinomycetota bacterium]|nr:hemolysin family protein [Actinomycetota bacterium]
MTGTDVIEIIAILLCIAGVGVMAASEVGITRTTKIRAYHLLEEGKRGAPSLLKIVENPPPYLNVVLLLTLVFTNVGVVLATQLATRHLHSAAELIATIVMTLLLFIFAEVTPKTYAIQHTDRLALRTAPLILGLGRLLGPLAKLLVKLAYAITPGRGLPQGPYVTEQEIRTMADVASDEDQIEEEEADLIHSIFEFGDTIVREVMVPRPDIVAVDVSKSLRDVQDMVVRWGYSRLPVIRGDLDDIVGFVYAKDVLKAIYQGKNDMPLEQITRPAHFVPEVKKVAELLREMQQQKFHIAMVSDEHGSVTGLVSLEDLLEELVGEITDEYDVEEAQVEAREDGSYLVDGRTPIDEVNEVLDKQLPDDEWDTVGGLIMNLLGAIPLEGEEVRYDDLIFRTEKLQGRRIAKVIIRPVEPEPSSRDAEAEPEPHAREGTG